MYTEIHMYTLYNINMNDHLYITCDSSIHQFGDGAKAAGKCQRIQDKFIICFV